MTDFREGTAALGEKGEQEVSAMEQKKVITKPSLEEDKIHGTREFPVQVYRENYAPYPMGIMDIHWHRFLELDIVVKGKIKIQDGDKEYILETGQGIFVNSNVLHKSRALGVPGETEQISLIFAPEFLAPSDSAIYKEEIQPFLGQEGISTEILTPEIPWQREVLRLSMEAGDRFLHLKGNRMEIHLLLCRIWKILVNEARERTEKEGNENGILQERGKKMLTYIEEHYAEPITAEDLADAAKVSRTECFRCFKEVTGQKPFAYLNRYRLRQAALLLKNTDLSICEVGNQCGFSYQSYFGKMFREAYGMTPFEYRKMVDHNPDLGEV